MKTKLESKTVRLTKELAVAIADMTDPGAGRWVGERSLTPSRVAWLRREFDQGRFHDPYWVFASFEDKWWRMDGQHSSKMLSELDDSFPENLDVHVSRWKCDSVDDMMGLYRSFNSPKSVRKAEDIVGAEMAFTPLRERDDVTRRIANQLTMGISYYRSDTKSVAPVLSRGEIVRACPDFISAAAEFVPIKKLYNVGIGAAMFGTHAKAELDDWRDFWTRYFEESDEDPQAPTRVLSRYVRSVRSVNTKADRRRIYVKAIRAWNADAAGRTSPLPDSQKLPVITRRRGSL